MPNYSDLLLSNVSSIIDERIIKRKPKRNYNNINYPPSIVIVVLQHVGTEIGTILTEENNNYNNNNNYDIRKTSILSKKKQVLQLLGLKSTAGNLHTQFLELLSFEVLSISIQYTYFLFLIESKRLKSLGHLRSEGMARTTDLQAFAGNFLFSCSEDAIRVCIYNTPSLPL